MPASPPLTITRPNVNDALYQALFVCERQQSDNPTTTMIRCRDDIRAVPL